MQLRPSKPGCNNQQDPHQEIGLGNIGFHSFKDHKNLSNTCMSTV